MSGVAVFGLQKMGSFAALKYIQNTWVFWCWLSCARDSVYLKWGKIFPCSFGWTFEIQIFVSFGKIQVKLCSNENYYREWLQTKFVLHFAQSCIWKMNTTHNSGHKNWIQDKQHKSQHFRVSYTNTNGFSENVVQFIFLLELQDELIKTFQSIWYVNTKVSPSNNKPIQTLLQIQNWNLCHVPYLMLH